MHGQVVHLVTMLRIISIHTLQSIQDASNVRKYYPHVASGNNGLIPTYFLTPMPPQHSPKLMGLEEVSQLPYYHRMQGTAHWHG